MFRRIFACFMVVSATIAMASALVTAQPQKLPAGSKVFIASMDGSETWQYAVSRIRVTADSVFRTGCAAVW